MNILYRPSNDFKLQFKEMLLIRHAITLWKRINSNLFTLIMRNTQQEKYITRDIQKYQIRTQ